MSEKRLVIFDLDNTLVINKPAAKAAYEAAIRYLCKEAKLDFDKVYIYWKRLVQSLSTQSAPEQRAFEYSLSQVCIKYHIVDKLIPPTLKVYEKELITALKPMPGAKEVVSWLKEQGSLVAVAAGTDRSLAKKKLKSTGLLPFIDFMVTASDIGQMKPNPGYYTVIMSELEVKPAQTMVVSDSKTEDIIPAKKLDLKTIEIPPTNTQLTALKPALAEFLSFAQ
jgi:HAD superfamily hydrolase (TIGR01509 family)